MDDGQQFSSDAQHLLLRCDGIRPAYSVEQETSLEPLAFEEGGGIIVARFTLGLHNFTRKNYKRRDRKEINKEELAAEDESSEGDEIPEGDKLEKEIDDTDKLKLNMRKDTVGVGK